MGEKTLWSKRMKSINLWDLLWFFCRSVTKKYLNSKATVSMDLDQSRSRWMVCRLFYNSNLVSWYFKQMPHISKITELIISQINLLPLSKTRLHIFPPYTLSLSTIYRHKPHSSAFFWILDSINVAVIL